MLTQLTIRNFKRFDEAEIELGEVVVFIGPNNSGKTTALQALALWDLGVRRLMERRNVPSVAINRKDLVALPVPEAQMLWRDLSLTQDVRLSPDSELVKAHIPMDIIVKGVTDDRLWESRIAFLYANEESLACIQYHDFPIPPEATNLKLAFLPPMSGLTANEPRLDPGALNVRIGEGRTAEVLRNLCFGLFSASSSQDRWSRVRERILKLFGVTLEDPEYIASRGEIAMAYRDRRGIRLDLSAAGRGLQQMLLLLAYLYTNPGSILLLDEPDAHLEILRQREMYQVLTDVAREQGSQIIAASHSEVVLNEAADRDVVIAFVGKPHRIDDRGNQLLKSLKEIGFDAYYQAEQTGWVLYLEGSTDLAILRAFANILGHPAAAVLERPFVHFVVNQPNKAREHFFGLREAKPDLVGFALFDRLGKELHGAGSDLRLYEWRRREIENYFCFPQVLERYAEAAGDVENPGPLFAAADREHRKNVMRECVAELVPPIALRNLDDPWWKDTKATDAFLDRLFANYFQRLNLPNLMRKTDYHQLARLLPADLVDPEIPQVLDTLLAVAQQAKPVGESP